MATSVEIVSGLYAAFAVGDVPAVLGALDPAMQWNEAENSTHADGNPYVGPEGAGGLFMRLVTDIEPFAVHPENFIDAGDTVVVEGRYRGTWKATGKPVDAQFAHVWQVANGKVVRFQQYTDTKQWSEASTP